ADLALIVANEDIITGDFKLTLDAGPLDVSILLAVSNSNGSTGTIDASAASSLNGSAADILLAIADTSIVTPENFDSTVGDEDVLARDLLAIAAFNGDGTVTATAAGTIVGSVVDILEALDNDDITLS